MSEREIGAGHEDSQTDVITCEQGVELIQETVTDQILEAVWEVGLFWTYDIEMSDPRDTRDVVEEDFDMTQDIALRDMEEMEIAFRSRDVVVTVLDVPGEGFDHSGHGIESIAPGLLDGRGRSAHIPQDQ